MNGGSSLSHFVIAESEVRPIKV